MDDWIPRDRIDDFTRLAAKLGLVVRVDCIFRDLPKSRRVLGIEYSPTTRALGCPFLESSQNDPSASVHVIISKRADWADEALAAAWYSVAVEDRVIFKPRVDHTRLGRAFGYPECCIQFFIDHQNWTRQNTLVEAERVSSGVYWETNSLPKATPWMTIFHMPCSFDCPTTRQYSRAVLKEVSTIDDEYALRIKSFMRQPYLVINEKLAYALVGGVISSENRASFEQAIDVYSTMSYREAHYDYRSRLLASGNEVLLAEGLVTVCKDGCFLENLELRCDQGIVEIPQLLGFQ